MATGTTVGRADPARPLPQEDHRANVAVITGLRGLAALSVVLIHSAGRTDYPGIGIQTLGPVTLFVLSGFLLFRPWSAWALEQADRPSVRTFARRRLYRIFPAYLVVLLCFAVLDARSQPNGWDGWVRAVTLTHTTASDGLRPGFEQTWSLATELTWYVALPVIGVVVGTAARRARPRAAFWIVTGALASSILVTAAWRWWVAAENLGPRFTFSFWLPGFLVCFAAGAMVSHLQNGERAGLVNLAGLRGVLARQWPLLLLLVAAVAVAVSPLTGPDVYAPGTFAERQLRFVTALVLAASLLVGAALGPMNGLLNRLLQTRWLNAVGRWSYGIYLWHLPVIALLVDEFRWRSGPDGFVLWIATVLAISLVLGAASWAWVERPAIARSKYIRQTAPLDPATAPATDASSTR